MHACMHSKNRNVVTKSMLFQLNVGHKDVVYGNFQTPKVHMFSEHKIPTVWIGNIH